VSIGCESCTEAGVTIIAFMSYHKQCRRQQHHDEQVGLSLFDQKHDAEEDGQNHEGPLTFGNKIAYSLGDSEELIRVDNDFYVSKISNYASKDITKFENTVVCGKKKQDRKRVFKESGPNQFYIEYSLVNATYEVH